MQAVVCTQYGPPEVLKIVEKEKPQPKDNEVLIKVYASSVTVADSRIRSFRVPPSFWIPARLMLGIRRPKKPILGMELAGEIEAVGKDVKRFKMGDHIFGSNGREFGGYAEYKCLPEDAPIAIKPSEIGFAEAVAIPVGALTALHFLKRGNIKAGQKVLIYGSSGSVGTYAVQLAKYYGTEVTAICSGKNMEWVKKLGADKVIDYTEKDFTQKLEKYDIILLAIDKWPFSSCKLFLKEEGIYLNVTEPFKSLSMIWHELNSKQKIIMGESPPESFEDLEFLMELVKEGLLKPVIDKIYPLDQIVEAHQYVDQGHKRGNVVVRVTQEAQLSPDSPYSVVMGE